ncbi:MAG: type II toxin-antitoxin system YafQ family toxin [Candidatus Peribacteraceae bacterium]|nr:type II toxin-antitoxin system YafQ family toxin [Candidatus Peribacteraceae bacterium]
MKFAVVATNRYRQDYKYLAKTGLDTGKLEQVIDLLAAGIRLPESYHDHGLHGDLQGTRACHIGPDWLLQYVKDSKHLVLILISTGDHRRVLGVE